MPRNKIAAEIIGSLLKEWRGQAGFTQDELEALSRRLVAEGIIDVPMQRAQFGRYERGEDAAQAQNLRRVAYIYAAALNEAGFETTGDDLYALLTNVDLPATRRTVSDEAAELDAILAPLGSHPSRADIYAGFMAMAREIMRRFRERSGTRRKPRA